MLAQRPDGEPASIEPLGQLRQRPQGRIPRLRVRLAIGIVQEHGGKILCYNSQEGGAVFRVELPAVLAALPTRDSLIAGSSPAVAKNP